MFLRNYLYDLSFDRCIDEPYLTTDEVTHRGCVGQSFRWGDIFSLLIFNDSRT